MATKFSFTTYIANSTIQQFIISFPYESKDEIKVYVNDVDTSYTWINDSTVQLTGLSGGETVEVRRELDKTTKGASFITGDSLSNDNIGTVYTKLFRIAQEVWDKASSIDTSTQQTTINNVNTEITTARLAYADLNTRINSDLATNIEVYNARNGETDLDTKLDNIESVQSTYKPDSDVKIANGLVAYMNSKYMYDGSKKYYDPTTAYTGYNDSTYDVANLTTVDEHKGQQFEYLQEPPGNTFYREFSASYGGQAVYGTYGFGCTDADFLRPPPLTIEWYGSQTNFVATRPLFGVYTATTSDGFGVYIDSSHNFHVVFANTDTTTNLTTGASRSVHHVVLTIRSDYTVELWVDGTKATTSIPTTGWTSPYASATVAHKRLYTTAQDLSTGDVTLSYLRFYHNEFSETEIGDMYTNRATF